MKRLLIIVAIMCACLRTMFAAGFGPVPSPDATSFVYMTVRGELSASDSAQMFLPFSSGDVDKYSVSVFGIRSKFVKVEPEVVEHFHIDIYKNKVREQYPWEVFVPIVTAIALALLAMFTQRGYISRLFLVVFYRNAFINAVGEKNVNADKAGALLFVSYVINVALFAVVCLYRNGLQLAENFWVAFFAILASILVFYYVKRVFSYFLSKLFGCEDVFGLHYKNTSYIMHSMAIVLMVSNVLSFYVPSLEIHNFVFYLTVVICSLAWAMKIFRLFAIIFEKRFPLFYLFLYLCAVEFLPIALAIKIVSL